MTPHDIFKHRIKPYLIAFLIWLNDRLVTVNDRITRFKQRHGL